jgi:hypothetical protein
MSSTSSWAVTLSLFTAIPHAWSQTVPPPASGQPNQSDHLNQFEIVGNSLVCAQQVRYITNTSDTLTLPESQKLFVGTPDSKVYIVDKTENNAAQINGHPAWGSGN